MQTLKRFGFPLRHSLGPKDPQQSLVAGISRYFRAVAMPRNALAGCHGLWVLLKLNREAFLYLTALLLSLLAGAHLDDLLG